ncbi:MAG TPA: YciI family protein [Euzebyales bacterium]|nr:YciI family protein [Euzebyales bacterium]
MRFMITQSYGRAGKDEVPITEWSQDDVAAHIEFQNKLNDELVALGELVDAQGLAGPESAKFVVSNGTGVPVVTDGPFSEFKELLAGYRVVDVESEERAIAIAARISAAPGANGQPLRDTIEVRQILSLETADT